VKNGNPLRTQELPGFLGAFLAFVEVPIPGPEG